MISLLLVCYHPCARALRRAVFWLLILISGLLVYRAAVIASSYACVERLQQAAACRRSAARGRVEPVLRSVAVGILEALILRRGFYLYGFLSAFFF